MKALALKSPLKNISVAIIITGVVLGATAFVVSHNFSVRGNFSLNANVRIADGNTEDELMIAETTVTKEVVPMMGIMNKTEYRIDKVAVSESENVILRDCTVPEAYQPKVCHATTGTPYWVTLVAL